MRSDKTYDQLRWKTDKAELLELIEDKFYNQPNKTWSQTYVEICNTFPNIGIGEKAIRTAINSNARQIGGVSFANRLERKRLQYERRVIDTYARREAFNDTMAKVMIKEMTSLLPVKFTPPPACDNDQVPRYGISDQHSRGVIDNHFTDKYFSIIEADIRKHKYKRVKLILFGDDIEGELHINSLQADNEGIARATANIIWQYINWFKRLADATKVLEIFFVDKSNHGQIRLHGSKRGDFPDNDVGVIIGSAIKYFVEHHGKKRIEFHDSEGHPQGLVIDGHYLYLHGHQDFAGRGSIEKALNNISAVMRTSIINQAITDTENYVNAAESLLKKEIYVVWMGHWHEYWVRDLGGLKRLVINPALKWWMGAFENRKLYLPKPALLKIIGDKAELIEYIAVPITKKEAS